MPIPPLLLAPSHLLSAYTHPSGSVNGSSTWKSFCTVTTAPYSCRFDTTMIADGTYSVRAIATDVAGNATTSAVVANRVVDNTVSSVAMEDPGTYLRGTATLVATASSTAGVTSVRIQYAPTGTTTWTDVCTDTTSPYSCAWYTTTVADGSYDVRAILLAGDERLFLSVKPSRRRKRLISEVSASTPNSRRRRSHRA